MLQYVSVVIADVRWGCVLSAPEATNPAEAGLVAVRTDVSALAYGVVQVPLDMSHVVVLVPGSRGVKTAEPVSGSVPVAGGVNPAWLAHAPVGIPGNVIADWLAEMYALAQALASPAHAFSAARMR